MSAETPAPPCGAACLHESVVHCTLPTGHRGPHETYGDRYPGNPVEKTICTWSTR